MSLTGYASHYTDEYLLELEADLSRVRDECNGGHWYEPSRIRVATLKFHSSKRVWRGEELPPELAEDFLKSSDDAGVWEKFEPDETD